mmetsp:Transcript_26715/g.87616  ORF Transcript_26715/g.87616 Transcript_26715/m.87616 type:complete len:208 (-) Transcript_26715:934-1557(-)
MSSVSLGPDALRARGCRRLARRARVHVQARAAEVESASSAAREQQTRSKARDPNRRPKAKKPRVGKPRTVGRVDVEELMGPESAEQTIPFDDETSRNFALALAEAADDVKGVDILVLHVAPTVAWTRYFVIVTALSRPQQNAIMARTQDLARDFFGRDKTKPPEAGSWTVVDFGDVICHIMSPQQREFYGLELLYKDATPVPLPFQR